MTIYKLTWSREQDHGTLLYSNAYVSKRVEKQRYYFLREKAQAVADELQEAAKELGEMYSVVITEVEVIE